MKWIAPTLVYLAVGLGIFVFHNAWIALLAFHLVIIASLFLAKPNLPISVLTKSNNLHWVILSVLLCGSSGLTLYFLWEYFSVATDLSIQVESFGLNISTWPAFMAYFTFVNPFIEEYFWRGYLGNSTKDFSVSDLLYAGYHGLILIDKVQIGPIIYSLIALTTASWLWRQIAREDHGLLAPVLGHMAADLTILLAIYWKI